MRDTCLFVVGALLASSSPASSSEPPGLKVVSRSAKAAVLGDGGNLLTPPGYTVTLRNESVKTITAWSLECLAAEGSGDFATSTVSYDDFLLYEMQDELGLEERTTGRGTVVPDAELEVFIPRDDPSRPYQASRCRVGAVIYADGSAEGEAKSEAALVHSRAAEMPTTAERSDSTGHLLLPTTQHDKSSVDQPTKAGEPGGCTIGGGSTGAAAESCGSHATKLSFGVTALCSNPCTGNTWQTSSANVTATSPCHCGVTYEEFNHAGPGGSTRATFTSSAYSSHLTSSLCSKTTLAKASVTCSCPGCGDPSPILISLSDNHYQLTDADAGVLFGSRAEGTPEQTAWTATGSDEAFLVLDRNMNDEIDTYLELFGSHSPQLPTEEPNGWRGLAVFDDPLNGGNGDGVIDINDDIFTALQLWLDENHNGISEPSELSSLEEVGVEYLNLAYESSNRTDRFGNAFKYWSTVGTPRGDRRAWNVFFGPK